MKILLTIVILLISTVSQAATILSFGQSNNTDAIKLSGVSTIPITVTQLGDIQKANIFASETIDFNNKTIRIFNINNDNILTANFSNGQLITNNNAGSFLANVTYNSGNIGMMSLALNNIDNGTAQVSGNFSIVTVPSCTSAILLIMGLGWIRFYSCMVVNK